MAGEQPASIPAKRLVSAIPYGQWKTPTFIANLRQDGAAAPGVFDGAINGQTFLAYVEQVVVPAPRAGEIVIMNNLAFHKVTGVRLVIDGWQSTSLPFRQRCV